MHMSRGKLLYVCDPGHYNFQGVKELGRNNDIFIMKHFGWFVSLNSLSRDLEREQFELFNRHILEQIVCGISREDYNAIIIDGVMAFVLQIGYYLIDDVLERSPESLDGTIKDIPLVIANPAYRHDMDLFGSGSDFGIREGVDASGAIDGLLQDPMRAHPAVVYNEDLYREEGRFIVHK